MTGCSLLPKFNFFDEPEEVRPVEIACQAEPKPPLNIDNPQHLDLSNANVKWKILPYAASEEAEAIPYFCMTEQGYKDLSKLLVELRDRLETQRAITQQYRDYYETTDSE